MRLRTSLIFSSLVLALLTGGCTTGEVVPGVNRPLNYVKFVVQKTVPGGVRRISENGREFYSGYFFPRPPYKTDNISKQKSRAYAHVLVLGDRRPYKIEVRVIREERDQGRYVKVGTDPAIAQHIAAMMRDELADRREDLNIIDDFRAF